MTHLSEAILRNTKGLGLILHDPLAVRSLRGAVDFFLLDLAARPCDPSMLDALILAAGETGFLVRPGVVSAPVLQGLLNAGVDGLILPDMHYAAELEKIIASCLYPPEGIRPYRPVMAQEKTALDALNDQITFVVEVNHPQTLTQLEDIAEVTGINGLLVCPERLSVAMEKGGDTDHPAVQQALQTIARVAASYELPWGMEGESEALSGLNPDFVLPVRDIDVLVNSLSPKGRAGALSQELGEEDDFAPFMLAARRE